MRCAEKLLNVLRNFFNRSGCDQERKVSPLKIPVSVLKTLEAGRKLLRAEKAISS